MQSVAVPVYVAFIHLHGEAGECGAAAATGIKELKQVVETRVERGCPLSQSLWRMAWKSLFKY
jgi:hypothetical protein